MTSCSAQLAEQSTCAPVLSGCCSVGSEANADLCVRIGTRQLSADPTVVAELYVRRGPTVAPHCAHGNRYDASDVHDVRRVRTLDSQQNHHHRSWPCRSEFIARVTSRERCQGKASALCCAREGAACPSAAIDGDALSHVSCDEVIRRAMWTCVAFSPVLDDALDDAMPTSTGTDAAAAAARLRIQELVESRMCQWMMIESSSWSCCRRGDDARGPAMCLAIVLTPRLFGGGCKQSSDVKTVKHMPLVASPLVGGNSTSAVSGSAGRPLAPLRPPPPQVLKMVGSPHIAVSTNAVLYTRRAVGDDDVITVHGVEDNDILSEVDVHSVDMHQLGYVGLPPPPNDRSGGATSDREHNGNNRKSTARKSVSELSRASSRNTMMSFEHVVSGAASEFNESAVHGHCDSVLRRLLIDRGPNGELGRGGFGVVYSAHDQVNGQVYAVKEARYGSTGGEALMGNLRSEFRTLSQLSHPNVIRVYNFLIDEEERIARIVLELAANGSVRKLLGRSVSGVSPNAPGRLSEAIARRVVFQALLGLHYLHRHGIIHRDIKPDNLLLGEDSVVKLSDFGTCKSTIHASTGTTTTVVGTVCYMSPESISGSFSMGSDIWSVGATTIELLSGLAPWSELRCTQSIHLVFQIGSARPPNHKPQYPAPQLNVSRSATQFLDACLLYDAKQRPTAADLLSFAWFDNITAELPLSVRQHLMKHPLPASTWRAPPATTSPLLAGVPTTRAVPRVASRGEAPVEVDGDDEDDTFESWPSDEEEEVKPTDDDEYEYEYI